MLLNDLLRLSLHNLLLHKIRSFLTSLGIIFGVGSVISMLAISEGAKRESLSQIEAMGIDNIIVHARKPSLAGSSDNKNSNSSMVQVYGLTRRDLEHIRLYQNVKGVTTITDARKKVLKGLTRLDVILASTTPEFLETSKSRVTDGRWLSEVDMKNKSCVCVIGRDAARKIFALKKSSIIGSNIRIENGSFRIVGIFENEHGARFPQLGSPNDMIFIPASTGDAFFNNYAYQREGRQLSILQVEYDVFIVTIANLEAIDDTAKRITSYMEKTHSKLKDWGMIVPIELLRQKEKTQNIFTVVMASIASISLIVGGVGIMNIMLANVYERRREIGTRRALGAKKKDILSQFLIETVFLTSIGGLLGISLGVGISKVITFYAGWPVIFSLWSIALSMFISGMVGVLFGTYPAWKAAQQNPIEVLRSE